MLAPPTETAFLTWAVPQCGFQREAANRGITVPSSEIHRLFILSFLFRIMNPAAPPHWSLMGMKDLNMRCPFAAAAAPLLLYFFHIAEDCLLKKRRKSFFFFKFLLLLLLFCFHFVIVRRISSSQSGGKGFQWRSSLWRH